MVDEQASGELSRNVDNLRSELTSEILLNHLVKEKEGLRWTRIKRGFVVFAILAGIVFYGAILAGSLGYRPLPMSDSVAVVPIEGVIANYSTASAEGVITVLDKMFQSDSVKGIVLLIDSGGGSPGESERIQRFIDKKRAETGKRVVAACANMCASAAYMIALHTDRIYAGEYTWVGSIGAVMKGWDFDKVLDKYDVDQRVFASGPLKDMLNPYTELSDEGAAKANRLVNKAAEVFAADVREQRGQSLRGEWDFATGEVWTGPDSLSYGLIDEIGTLEDVLANEFPGTPPAVYRPKDRSNTLFETLLGEFATALVRAANDETMKLEM